MTPPPLIVLGTWVLASHLLASLGAQAAPQQEHSSPRCMQSPVKQPSCHAAGLCGSPVCPLRARSGSSGSSPATSAFAMVEVSASTASALGAASPGGAPMPAGRLNPGGGSSSSASVPLLSCIGGAGAPARRGLSCMQTVQPAQHEGAADAAALLEAAMCTPVDPFLLPSPRPRPPGHLQQHDLSLPHAAQDATGVPIP
jgi:hypothetical protein